MDQLPDGRYHWEPGVLRPLCFTCMADGDLWRYKHNGESLYFCSSQCADKWATENNAEADHTIRKLYDKEPYNGASKGYSPFDMLNYECDSRYEQDEYDVCDDAEDYGEEL